MQYRQLGTTPISIAPLVLGGNVFGWTADRQTSFALLDQFLEAGGNAIDTADVYNRYAPGLVGGESESVIGEWLQSRGVRDRVVLITKVGLPMGEGLQGLGRDYMKRACEASLRRLRTDRIDIYLSHAPDQNTPIEETLEAYQSLIEAGKVGHAGCSNYAPAQLQAALAAAGGSRARYEVVQPQYNLLERADYEDGLEPICVRHRLGVVTYFALAAGFLTGKYRGEADLQGKARGGTVAKYLNPEGLARLAAVDEVAARHGATPTQVALAWLMARPSVTAPIASATSAAQLRDILKAAALTLAPEDFQRLEAR